MDESADLRVTETTRGRKKLYCGGYGYVLDKASTEHQLMYWRCENRRECSARIHTDADCTKITSVVREHTHEPNPGKAEVAEFRVAVKRRAKETSEQPSQIAAALLQEVSTDVVAQLPNAKALYQMISRKRNDNDPTPPAPVDVAQLEIPANYLTYEPSSSASADSVENFLLIDSGQGDCNRILVFGRESWMQNAEAYKHIFMDGTFQSAPRLFAQVFVILAVRDTFLVPLLYCLLPDRSQKTYCRLLRLVRGVFPSFLPTSIGCDFEVAAYRAAHEVFENAHIFGCFFHFAKILKQKLSDTELLSLFAVNADFAANVRMLLALAFVPSADLETAFEVVCDLLHGYEDLLNWFEDNYLGRPTRNGPRRAPIFPPKMWSVFEQRRPGAAGNDGDGEIENVDAEASHCRLHSTLDVKHPSLWRFIDAVRSSQKSFDRESEKTVRADEQPAVKRKKSGSEDPRIVHLMSTYADRKIVDYLRGICYFLTLDW